MIKFYQKFINKLWLNASGAFLSIFLLLFACKALAFSWEDLWLTKDQQAANLMKEGLFSKAQSLFEQGDWQASAAYRAGNYQEAEKKFSEQNNEQGNYNLGNALAHLGKYKEAIKAYDKALAMNPSNQDAIYNRNLVESLLKKEEKKNKEKSSDKQNNKNKQDNNQQGNQSQNSQQENSSQNNSDKKNQDEPNNSAQDESNNNAEDNKNQNDMNQNQDKKDSASDDDKKEKKDKKAEDGQRQDKKDAKAQNPQSSMDSQEEEKQQAKEQWLRLIPDDPGGLLREKFLRDYIRRQRGWIQ